VAGCPVAGVDPEEIIDATPQMLEVNRHLTDNRDFSNLPRKYKISISGCHIHCAQPDINCVGVFGLRRETASGMQAGFGIKVGGGLAASPHMAQTLPVFIEPEQVWPVVKAVSTIYRDHGFRHQRAKARLKFLMADWGVEKFTAEIHDLLGYSLTPHQDFVFPEDPEADHLGIFPQKQAGLFWVGISFAGGRLRGTQLAVVGQLAKKYSAPGLESIRLTNKQNLLLLNIPEANLSALKAELDANGLIYEASNFRQGCVSCTGIEFCNLAVAETKNRMVELVGQLESTSSWYQDKIRIHFSGCPSSCGQHQIADIGLRGARTKIDGVQVDAFDMFVGGRLGATRRFNTLLKGKIPASNIHLAIDKVLGFYKEHRQEGESFARFTDRVSKDEILTVFS